MGKETISAQKIIQFIREVNVTRIHLETGILKENEPLLQEIYKLAEEVEAYDAYRNGEDRVFWITAPKGSYQEFVENFQNSFVRYDKTDPEHISTYLDEEKMKAEWPKLFPSDTVWFRLYLARHNDARGLSLNRYQIVNTTEQTYKKRDYSDIFKWILEEEKKVIQMIKEGSYQEYLEKNLPYQHRSGVINQAEYWKFCPEEKESLYKRINFDEFDEFKKWDPAKEDYGLTEITTGDYFKACDVLYDLLGIKEKYPLKIENPTPRDCYKAYSDGRDGGWNRLRLRDIDETSVEIFEKWMEENIHEEHAWEFCFVPSMYLRPVKDNGKYYYSLTFYNMDWTEYGELIHLELELKKRGFPVLKSEWVEDKITGNQLIGIVPMGDEWDFRYARRHNIQTEDFVILPNDASEEFIKKVEWFPIVTVQRGRF